MSLMDFNPTEKKMKSFMGFSKSFRTFTQNRTSLAKRIIAILRDADTNQILRYSPLVPPELCFPETYGI